MLDFRRFPAPHKGAAIALLLHEKIEKWSLETKIISVTTDYASDMTNSISQLHALLNNSYPSSYSTLNLFHIRCFAHVINLSVKELIKILHYYMDEVRSMIIAVCASTK